MSVTVTVAHPMPLCCAHCGKEIGDELTEVTWFDQYGAPHGGIYHPECWRDAASHPNSADR